MKSLPLLSLDDLLYLPGSGGLREGVINGSVWPPWVGGGAGCRLFYRDYLGQLLTAMGVGPLPEDAFGQAAYCTDWLDTAESQRLLHYQRHTFDDIVDQVGQKLGFGRYLVPFVRPLVRRSILKLSPYRSRKDE